MVLYKRFFYGVSGFCFLAFSQGLAADWVLENKQSSLNWLSNKLVQKSHKAVYEHNRFRNFSATVDAAGIIQLDVNLNSVDTKVPVRDERIRKYVFVTDKYPLAHLRGKMSLAALTALKIGETRIESPKFTLEMHGVSHEITPKISITKLANQGFAIQSIEPVLVDAAIFGMSKGFEKLRELVHLFNIPTVIPVSFRMVFVQSEGPH